MCKERGNKQNLENTIPDYFERITKNSWTWHRLTEDEKRRFTSINFSKIKGSERQRIEAYNAAYLAFLTALGYNGYLWREPAEGSGDRPLF